ncbi:MAG TPA: phenylalanine--tRNA ligase subunit beta [Ktedonobacterales bacterium]
MRIPYPWLKDYVDITLSPEDLAEKLTLAGLEVERVEYPWPGIVTAEIIWLQRIKGSDHLSATRVSTGTQEFSVVCGASNIKLHDKVPLATIGAKVGEITIAEKKAMGVLSQGMLCSPRELGISDDHEGIYILPPDTPLGVPLGKLLGDAVIDLDIKAHRGDLFCVTGIAREVSAITRQPLRLPAITSGKGKLPESGEGVERLMKLEVRDPDLCPRYSARIIRGVKIGPSPEWMAKRLLAAGMRPINNIVDVTNYVMLELGQPLHAFDYAKVKDHTIIVRRAKHGEKLTTLDGVERSLTSEMLLITDPAGPNVIAGIFGGERVEVSAETTDLILEAAHFKPGNIRRTSAAIGLRTESSGRFEKNPDIELTVKAIDRAAELILQLAGGTLAPGRIDAYPKPEKPRAITFALAQVEWLIGVAVTTGEAIEALTALGFGVREMSSSQSQVVLDIKVPSWRGDVEEGADLVEEIARIAGFDRIPSTIPTGPLPAAYRNEWWERENLLRDIMVGAGLTEIMSYTLTSRQVMAKLLVAAREPGAEALLGAPAPIPLLESPTRKNAKAPAKREQRALQAIADDLPAIRIKNPMSAEAESLRLTLMAGMLTAVRENSKHERAGIWLFEIGRRYLPTAELARGEGLSNERRTLALALSGPPVTSWAAEDHDADFYDMKGAIETMLRALQVRAWRMTPVKHPTFHPGRCAMLEVAALPEAGAPGGVALGETAEWIGVGILGEVHPEVADQFDLSRRTYLAELDLERLFAGVPAYGIHHAILRYPAAVRDLAFIVDASVPAAEVEAAIRGASGALLRDLALFDVYTGEGIGAGKRSLAYTLTFQASDRTLTDAEVDAAIQAVVAAVKRTHGAQLRG